MVGSFGLVLARESDILGNSVLVYLAGQKMLSKSLTVIIGLQQERARRASEEIM